MCLLQQFHSRLVWHLFSPGNKEVEEAGIPTGVRIGAEVGCTFYNCSVLNFSQVQLVMGRAGPKVTQTLQGNSQLCFIDGDQDLGTKNHQEP